MHPCPRCQHELTERAPGIEGCAGCGGVLLREALTQTVDALASEGDARIQSAAGASSSRPALSLEALRAQASCPVCAAPMKKHRVGLSLEVDACEHGTWFDAGELQRMKEAVMRGLAVVATREVSLAPLSKAGPDLPRAAPASPTVDVTQVQIPIEELTNVDGEPDYEAQARRMLALDQVAALAQIRREHDQLDRALHGRNGRPRKTRRGEDWLTKGLTALLFPEPERD